MKNPLKHLLNAAILAFGLTAAQAATVPVGGFLYGTNHWAATNEYILTNYTYVMSNAVLNIEPGTVIRGVNGTAPNFGALFITRGGKIFAEGTAEKPIIMTATNDVISDPFDLPIAGVGSRGLWGGVVVLGNARLNNSVAGSTNAPMYDVYEGLADTLVSGESIHRFGGTNDADNSGIIRYVSIRHAGKRLESNKELNGLSMGGVGNGTTIEYVETYLTADDGFEFFGGSVNTKYLISAFNDDDAFDTDQGYNGKNQFWFAIQTDDVRDSGGELNGQPQSPTVTIPGSQPTASYEVNNATWIGARAPGATNSAGNVGLVLRVHNFSKWRNCVFMDFATGINIDASSAPDVQNNLFFNLGANGTGYGTAFCPTNVNPIANPLLRGVSRTNLNNLDPRPMIGSPVYTGVATPSNGFFTPTSYKGAFDCENWMVGWTALDNNLFIGSLYNQPTNLVTITNQFLTGSNHWTADNIYLLTNYVYVMSNAVLTIDPGTVVKGRNGTAPNFGALFVTRGGKLMASGTACQPIIFTAETDNVNDPFDLPIAGVGSRGLWGGLVMLGNARINNSVAGSTNAPMYDVYEGLADTLVSGEAIHRFGGPDDNDSSGCVRYVSIRHAGKRLESNKELNGLSMGGVGRGTAIECVEAYLIADDGFEFFGGSVNTKYLISAFNDDDAFDTDQGYNGKNQFWFAIQTDDLRDSGGELNGQPQSPTVTIPGSLPLAGYEVYNATWLGAKFAGATNTAGNVGLVLRVQNFSKWYDSVFMDFATGINIDASSQPEVRHNLFFNLTANGTGYGTAFCPAGLNPIADPLLYGVSRTNLALLDPRPQPGSPAFTDYITPPENGFYVPTTYKGAFGAANWALDWSALSANAFFKSIARQTKQLPPVPITITPASGGNAVTWGTAAGMNYWLQCNTNLQAGAGWTNTTLYAGSGLAITVTNADTGAQKYFRVLATPK